MPRKSKKKNMQLKQVTTRLMQVIEKITRCMKAIILERQENKANEKKTTTINFADNSSIEKENGRLQNRDISPVRSLLDEDATQLSQDILSNTDGYWSDCDKIDNASQPLNTNLCKSSSKCSKHDQENLDLEKAISIISLHDDEEALDTNCEYSQSVLKNFDIDPHNNNSSVNIAPVVSNIDTKHLQLNLNNERTETISKITKTIERNINITFERANPPIVHVKEYEQTNTESQNTLNTIAVNKNCSSSTKPLNITEEKDQNFRKRKFKAPTKIKVDMTASVAEIKNKRIRKKDQQQSLLINKAKDAPKRRNKRNIDKKAEKKKNVSENKSGNVKTVQTDAATSKHPMDSELSWLEQIKYTRIVNNNEYEKNNLDECFWDNLTLPNNWSDQNNFCD
uniref:Uncharacterized protein n=1 Tax=Bombyx mori TaxID=7091 RepID=A0A8R2LYX0_BOMMO|nr:uncharacterized protein LOC119629028 isoform X2 [Bombyx mori]